MMYGANQWIYGDELSFKILIITPMISMLTFIIQWALLWDHARVANCRIFAIYRSAG